MTICPCISLDISRAIIASNDESFFEVHQKDSVIFRSLCDEYFGLYLPIRFTV